VTLSFLFVQTHQHSEEESEKLHLFKSFDVNHDSLIDFKEFSAVAQVLLGEFWPSVVFVISRMLRLRVFFLVFVYTIVFSSVLLIFKCTSSK